MKKLAGSLAAVALSVGSAEPKPAVAPEPTPGILASAPRRSAPIATTSAPAATRKPEIPNCDDVPAHEGAMPTAPYPFAPAGFTFGQTIAEAAAVCKSRGYDCSCGT